ncbi:MAG TPA: DMT family transporter [Polyangiaceae bacterium]|nr:DMT family transporter [Polyangiaceae bacterium]
MAYAVLSVMLFSGFTLTSRAGLTTGLRPPDVAALRFGIGGLLLAPVLVRHGRGGLRGRDAFALAFLGGLGFALFAYTGFWLAPAAHGSVLLHGTIPIFTSLLAGSASASRRGLRVGAALIAIGVVMMAYDSLAAARGRQLLGDGSLLLASLLWAAYGVRVRSSMLAPAHAASIVAVLSMCCFLPIYAFLPHDALLALGTRQLLVQVAVQGVLVGAVSIFVYTRAVSSLGPTVSSLFTAAVPCLTTLMAIPLLSETPSGLALLGMAIVTVGMAACFAAARPVRDRSLVV